MKKKKIFWIFSVLILIVILCGSIIIKSLTITSYGKVDSIFGVMSKIGKIFNPISLKEKSIYEMRRVLQKVTSIWNPKPISFSKIKNMDVKTDLNQVPVRIYTPIMAIIFL